MTQDAIPSILQKIVNTKQQEVAQAKAVKDIATIKAEAEQLLASGSAPRRGFANALIAKQQVSKPAIIAEVKKASPSKGIISPNFQPALTAEQYQDAGAACLSVLTDEQYFQGHSQYLEQAKAACQLPVLRKDFMIDPYQIYESYLMGADCILLIVACLDQPTLQQLHQVACDLGLDVLIEVHTQQELERALQLPDSVHNIYGINNRDLNTFNTDLQTSIKLKAVLDSNASEAATQPRLLVTESGIHSTEDMQLMLDNDIDCFLIGEQFMKTDNPGATLANLLNSLTK
ncbi:indole-3-glycerol phosphate synthase TrpC [Psychrobacter sp. FDAARGOS_221]|uniref:indole-3-glycerol phosphate synthase TrpC n=1 Tax=Psychrobacter sp. FDAARGOS_221 TaxID=1975705 RepID=UPI000BB560D3|nr:indole-3-glycerol phosphate synthase TrpC [Psychrobacter sp. FDAARGOS_221]PNK60002.1 indole-3-glycerol phosphate synthase TrpC [Psychrobacter sp. FDAARGOS_221]